MSNQDEEIVKVATGDLVSVELWQQALTEAGIRSRVVGTELSAGIGTAIPNAIELWVSHKDAEKAAAAIKFDMEHHGKNSEVPHGPVGSDSKIPTEKTHGAEARHHTPARQSDH